VGLRDIALAHVYAHAWVPGCLCVTFSFSLQQMYFIVPDRTVFHHGAYTGEQEELLYRKVTLVSGSDKMINHQ
jgi:hypothetical protein